LMTSAGPLPVLPETIELMTVEVAGVDERKDCVVKPGPPPPMLPTTVEFARVSVDCSFRMPAAPSMEVLPVMVQFCTRAEEL